MSSMLAIPVEIIIGLFFEATYSIRGISVISNEAILYAGTLSVSKKSTAVLSKGDEKHINPCFSASSNSNECHSQGVCASL